MSTKFLSMLSTYFSKFCCRFLNQKYGDGQEWNEVSENEAEEIFHPDLKVLNLKESRKEDVKYHWFQYPHHIEYKEARQIEIFCTFDFIIFPFDSHQCDFRIGSFGNSLLELPPLKIFYNDKSVTFGEEPLKIDQSLLPFDITLEPMKTILKYVDGFNYPYAGMRIYLVRHNMGLLAGGFYLPMFLFSTLSLISYLIKPEIVSLI